MNEPMIYERPNKERTSSVAAPLPLAHDLVVKGGMALEPLGYLLVCTFLEDANSEPPSGSRFRFLGAGAAITEEDAELTSCASAAARARVLIGALKIGGWWDME